MTGTVSFVPMVIAAACMARGLTAEEADKVQKLIEPQSVVWYASQAYGQLDAAISRVRDERIVRGEDYR